MISYQVILQLSEKAVCLLEVTAVDRQRATLTLADIHELASDRARRVMLVAPWLIDAKAMAELQRPAAVGQDNGRALYLIAFSEPQEWV